MAHIECYRSANLTAEIGFIRSAKVEIGETITIPEETGAILLWPDGALDYALTTVTTKAVKAEQWRRVKHPTNPFLVEVSQPERRLWLK